jgi:hypothetical protein
MRPHRPWRLLVPRIALADVRGPTAGPGTWVGSGQERRQTLFVEIDPACGDPAFRDPAMLASVRAVERMLTEDPQVRAAFRFLDIARALRRALRPPPRRRRERVPGRTCTDRRVQLLLIPGGEPKARHSARGLRYLVSTPAGLVQVDRGTSAIVISGLPGRTERCMVSLSRSLLHELAHYIHHFVQVSGLPYSGRERRHSVFDIRSAPFAYVEGEPQAFLAFLDDVTPGPGRSVRRPARRGAWLRHLVTANQFLRSELACGVLLAQLLNDPGLRRHYLRCTFYRAVLPAYPALARGGRLTRAAIRATISPAENAYIKYQFIRVKHDPANTLEFVNAYLSEYPSQRRRVQSILARVSRGRLVDPAARRLNLSILAARLRAAGRSDPAARRAAARLDGQASVRFRAVAAGLARLDVDVRAPLIARTGRGVVDLNRAPSHEVDRVLRIGAHEARKLVANRAVMRSGEFLHPMDLLRAPPRALRPGASGWMALGQAAASRVLAGISAAAGAPASPFWRARPAPAGDGEARASAPGHGGEAAAGAPARTAGSQRALAQTRAGEARERPGATDVEHPRQTLQQGAGDRCVRAEDAARTARELRIELCRQLLLGGRQAVPDLRDDHLCGQRPVLVPARTPDPADDLAGQEHPLELRAAYPGS